MIFQISYQKKADPNEPEIRTSIVSFQVVRNEKPPPEEVAQMVLKHSGGDFLEAPIKIKEGEGSASTTQTPYGGTMRS